VLQTIERFRTPLVQRAYHLAISISPSASRHQHLAISTAPSARRHQHALNTSPFPRLFRALSAPVSGTFTLAYMGVSKRPGCPACDYRNTAGHIQRHYKAHHGGRLPEQPCIARTRVCNICHTSALSRCIQIIDPKNLTREQRHIVDDRECLGFRVVWNPAVVLRATIS
jgi:hypothetical protein